MKTLKNYLAACAVTITAVSPIPMALCSGAISSAQAIGYAVAVSVVVAGAFSIAGSPAQKTASPLPA